MSRADAIREMQPQLYADVRLYPASEGGREIDALLGWSCLCSPNNDQPSGFGGWPLLGDDPLEPESERRLGFVFLSDDAAPALRALGKFYLWEGRFIGEAVVVQP